jgi:hypothetical protein
VLFDLDPTPRAIDSDGDPWVPAPEPSEVAIAAQGMADIVRTPLRLAPDALAATVGSTSG